MYSWSSLYAGTDLGLLYVQFGHFNVIIIRFDILPMQKIKFHHKSMFVITGNLCEFRFWFYKEFSSV